MSAPSDMNPWFYIPPKVLCIPKPYGGNAAKPGEMTTKQVIVAHAILVMSGWGRAPVLLNYQMIGDAIYRYGRVIGHSRDSVERSIKGSRVKGTYRPGLQANGWVVIGTYPGTRRLKAVMPSDALLDLCDLPADWREKS